MKKIIIIFLLISASWSFNACSKFDDINTDPNQTSEVSPSLLATNLILQSMQYPHVGVDFLYKDMLAKYISYMEGANNYQYNKLDRTYFSSLVKLTNVQKMQEAAAGSVTESTYRALGHFIRAYTFFNLTLAVGDIPYSEALRGEEGIINPKYDTQKEVFIGILSELDSAAKYFGSGRNFDGDPVYKGKIAKWQAASNSLSLKVLTHLWKKTSDSDLDVINRFNNIVTNGPLFQSNNDNFQTVYSTLEVENYPFYNSNFRKYPIMSTTLIDKMKELNDYRMFYFAEPALAQINGGETPMSWDAYVGVDPSDNYSSIAARYVANQISGINPRYYALAQGEPTFLLSYAEQCFIIAEGILRGWTAGDASDIYKKGVIAAMQFTALNTPDDPKYHHGMKITTTIINSYVAQPAVALSGSTEDQLQKIWQQRYFIGFMQNGWNTYYEYRRTGYPVLPINSATNLNSIPTQIPLRWLYPSKELSYNRENVEAALSRQFNGNDDTNERMWILQD